MKPKTLTTQLSDAIQEGDMFRTKMLMNIAIKFETNKIKQNEREGR